VPPFKSPPDSAKPGLAKLKTGRLDRRWLLAKAGLLAGARHVGTAASSWLLPEQARQTRVQDSLTREAVYFIQEMSKLKGSVVKVGQMMASWGDAFFPTAVTQALHALENQTVMMDWSSIHQQLSHELGVAKLREFTIDPMPIGCASLAQVHRATRLADDAQWCFKVQYPGIAQSIDADMATLTQLLLVTRLLPRTRAFNQWLDAVKAILQQEVDYRQELLATQRFQRYLAHQPAYRVPEVFASYSTARVLACSFEVGVPLNSEAVLNLPQARRDRLGLLCLQLFWQEIWHWGEMQTDPNFGNYLVQLGTELKAGLESESDTELDVLVLLDFGAVYRFDPDVLTIGRQLIAALFAQDQAGVTQALLALNFIDAQAPASVIADLYQLMKMAIEPFATDQLYDWSAANLTARLIQQIKNSAFSTHFKVPPKDVLFVGRKIMGAFSLLALLGARVNGYAVLQNYLNSRVT
jgi:predicted unusual protein kinase regulating ubiquinone biosynthesis (AarF/ABC1/UbiB family)